MSLLIIHFRKSFACGEGKRNDSIVIISRLYKSTAPPLNDSVCITSSSLSKPSLRIDLMWLLTLPEKTSNKVAISQADIQTGVVGICTFPFSPMVMISLLIVYFNIHCSFFFQLAYPYPLLSSSRKSSHRSACW